MSTTVPSASSADPQRPDRLEVSEALDAVCLSAPFRSSPQCKRVLTYIVEHTLAGEDELLRERVIGAVVFGRSPDYDAANDPVVRVRVAEVRKRLAQYYQTAKLGAGSLVIEIPAGSYKAKLVRKTPEMEAGIGVTIEPRSVEDPRYPAGLQSRKLLSKRGLVLSTVVISLVALGVAVGLRGRRQQDAFERFWAPVLTNPKPVNIYQAYNTVYSFTSKVIQEYAGPSAAADAAEPYADLRLVPGRHIDLKDVIPVKDQFITVGDSYLSSELCVLFARHNKLYHLRYGNDISYGEIRYAPTVLIGAFNNEWTLKITADLRFVFAGFRSVKERGGKNRVWTLKQLDDVGHTPEDYTIVSKVADAQTGQVLISAAGITQYGTRAAAEFLTTPTYLRNAFNDAPRGWPGVNCQFVLYSKVMKDAPGPPQIVASYFW